MVNIDPKLSLAHIRPDIRPALGFLIETILPMASSGKLESIIVIGTALNNDFHPKKSTINSIIVTTEKSTPCLKLLANNARAFQKYRLAAPLLITHEELMKSLVPLSMELLDYQFSHTVIFGKDPFGDLVIEKANIAPVCKHRLHKLIIEMKRTYIEVAGQPKMVVNLIMESLNEIMLIIKSILYLADIDRDKIVMPNIYKIAKMYNFDEKILVYLYQYKVAHEIPDKDQADFLFQTLEQTMEHILSKFEVMEWTEVDTHQL